MGRARLHFLPLLLCCAAQSNLFARGGGGVCNHLLDYGHLQVYLWMIIKQYINVHFGAEQFNCLSCFFLYTFSPSATFWLSEGIWECLIGVWTPDSRICSASGSVYCLGVGSEMVPIHMCCWLVGNFLVAETSFQRNFFLHRQKYISILPCPCPKIIFLWVWWALLNSEFKQKSLLLPGLLVIESSIKKSWNAKNVFCCLA